MGVNIRHKYGDAEACRLAAPLPATRSGVAEAILRPGQCM